MRVQFVLLILSLLALLCVSLTAGTKVSDEKIYDDVKIKLATDSVVMAIDFEIDVKEGVVTLGGKVRTQKQKDRAERVAKKVKGVVKVVNKLVVSL
ncbi:MAG: BON domain-containing protein [Acidobacteria bacterium]|nr:BON domain-containing protein [Acidobacteriota bacterium]